MNENQKRGKASRNKGARGERELANIFRDTYGYPVRRGYVFQGESDLVGLEGIHPEVKRKETFNAYAAMEQAVAEAEKRQDGVPTVFHRRDGKGWLVVMRLEDWVDLYGEWMDKTSQEGSEESDCL